MNIREQIKALELKREENKAELFELYAEQADRKLRWTAYQESTPLSKRLELEADIKDLEAERQHSKVELMRLKAQVKQHYEKTYRKIVGEVLYEMAQPRSGEIYAEINKRFEEQTREE